MNALSCWVKIVKKMTIDIILWFLSRKSYYSDWKKDAATKNVYNFFWKSWNDTKSQMTRNVKCQMTRNLKWHEISNDTKCQMTQKVIGSGP